MLDMSSKDEFVGELRRRNSSTSSFTSKCCKKCRRRRKKRLLQKLAHFREPDRKRNSSRCRSSSWDRRSPSIPLDPNRTSPSYLERRRITSARKPPVPYNRNWTDDSSSEDDDVYYRR